MSLIARFARLAAAFAFTTGFAAAGLAAAEDPLQQVDPTQVDVSRDRSAMTPDVAHRFAYASFLPPRVGDAAPDFALTTLSGHAVDLGALAAEKPVLLVFGSASCDMFRRHALARAKALRQELAGRVEVLIVYTLEAHPALDPSPYTGAQWTRQVNVDDGVLVRQPTSYAERERLAGGLAARFGLDADGLVVDGFDNAVWQGYGGLPNMAYLIERGGRIVFKERWAGQSMDADMQRPQLDLALDALLGRGR